MATLTIITRNTKDFTGMNVRLPYELKTVSSITVVNIDPPGETPNQRRPGRPTLTRKKSPTPHQMNGWPGGT